MKKRKHHENKTLREYRSTAIRNSWNREAWVEQVLKIASLKYNLEEADFENFVRRNRRKGN